MQKDFFDENKHRVLRSMFPNELADLYDTIVTCHDKYERDLNNIEVREVYRVENPTATRAKREVIAEVLSDIEDMEDIGNDVAKDVLQKMDDKKAPICDGIEMTRIYKPNAKPASKDGSWGFSK